MLSIILVNYNTYSYTENCIQSIYKQTQELEFEIIVVSNGSSDRDITELTHNYPLVQLIVNVENIGFAKANNIGIEMAKGECILLLNSDTELANNALYIATTCLLKNSDIGIVSAQLLYPNGVIQHSCQSFPSISAEILETTRLYKLFDRKIIAANYMNSFLNLNQNNYCDWVWGTFFMFRKSDLQMLKLKKLNDRFFMYGEDLEWCYQFHQIHLKRYYCADAKVIHYLGKSEFGNHSKKIATIINNELTCIKTYKGYFYALAIRFLRSFKFLMQSIKNKSCLQYAALYAFPK